jgi:hypothetical protein
MTGRTRRGILTRSGLMLLAAVTVNACGSTEPATDADRLARGRQLVQRMSARLAAVNVVTVTTTETRDRVHAAGRKESVSQTGVYTMRRPDRFYTKMTGGLGLESWYNGKTITIASHPEKVFAQAPMPDTIDRTLDALAERYDMALPLSDLFYASPEKALLADTTTGGYVGVENVGATQCVHLAFKDIGIEWELWLPAQGDPLPKRFKVVQTRRTGQPVVDVTFTEWNLAPQVTDATFVPKVPGDYEGIAVLQRAAAVKNNPPPAASPAPSAPAAKK